MTEEWFNAAIKCLRILSQYHCYHSPKKFEDYICEDCKKARELICEYIDAPMRAALVALREK